MHVHANSKRRTVSVNRARRLVPELPRPNSLDLPASRWPRTTSGLSFRDFLDPLPDPLFRCESRDHTLLAYYLPLVVKARPDGWGSETSLKRASFMKPSVQVCGTARSAPLVLASTARKPDTGAQ